MSRALSEFSIIETYFTPLGVGDADVVLGIGDDCAVLAVPAGYELAVSMDTLVAGVHFFPDVRPEDLGHKALAVNLSDLAAMGAMPKWFTLSITLPQADSDWLSQFCRGMAQLAQTAPITLIGGDTTHGPLSITIQVHGLLPTGQRLTRSGARIGDRVMVTGCLGDAGLALHDRYQQHSRTPTQQHNDQRLHRPQPRIAFGQALLPHATAAIDVSDGLLADLGHITKSSGVSAHIHCERLPLSDQVRRYIAGGDDWSVALAGGDDYELCFTLPPESVAICRLEAEQLQLTLTDIGEITPGDEGVSCFQQGRVMVARPGYNHFK